MQKSWSCLPSIGDWNRIQHTQEKDHTESWQLCEKRKEYICITSFLVHCNPHGAKWCMCSCHVLRKRPGMDFRGHPRCSHGEQKNPLVTEQIKSNKVWPAVRVGLAHGVNWTALVSAVNTISVPLCTRRKWCKDIKWAATTITSVRCLWFSSFCQEIIFTSSQEGFLRYMCKWTVQVKPH